MSGTFADKSFVWRERNPKINGTAFWAGETAIHRLRPERLRPEDYSRLVAWFREHEQSRWDKQMDRDSSAGKLDFLFDENEGESAAGLLREWPPRT